MSRVRSSVRIGVDEAGLGPTLGPLVVGVFATRESGTKDDLRSRLAEVVASPPCRDGRIEVGDSKAIHQGSNKFARLERSALATWCWLTGELPTRVDDLLAGALIRDFEREGDRVAPWWSEMNDALPIACSAAEVIELGRRLRSVGDRVGVEPLWYRADLLDPARINRELDEENGAVVGASKNTWSTHALLRVAEHALRGLGVERARVHCDMAGGRRSYHDALSRVFGAQQRGRSRPDRTGQATLFERAGPRIDVVSETRAACRYRIVTNERDVDLGFWVGGDELDPRISWASILAKYLRELFMRSFNRHFQRALPELRATAGYPEDARRFVAEVESCLGPAGGLARASWIRNK